MKGVSFSLLAILVGCDAPRPGATVPVGAPLLAPILSMMVSEQSPNVRVVLLDSTISIPPNEWAGLREGVVGDAASALADMLIRSQRRWPIASPDSPVPLVSQLASDPATLVVSVSALGVNRDGTAGALYWTVSVAFRVTHSGVTLFARDSHGAPWAVSTTRRLVGW